MKSSHDDPDQAVVVESKTENGSSEVSVAFGGPFGGRVVAPDQLPSYCEENEITLYSYPYSDLEPV